MHLTDSDYLLDISTHIEKKLEKFTNKQENEKINDLNEIKYKI